MALALMGLLFLSFGETCGAHILLGTVIRLFIPASVQQSLYTCTWTNLYIGASLTSVEVWRVEFSFSKSGNEQIHKQTNTRIHTSAFYLDLF